MVRSFLILPRLLPVAALLILQSVGFSGSAAAGTFTNGVWKSDGCGEEPLAPTLHTESSSAYKESIQWVQLYQQSINAYNACLVKEANADVSAINQTVRASQHRSNNAFEQFNAASKTMNGRSSDDDQSGTPEHGRRGQQGGFSVGSGGGD